MRREPQRGGEEQIRAKIFLLFSFCLIYNHRMHEGGLMCRIIIPAVLLVLSFSFRAEGQVAVLPPETDMEAHYAAELEDSLRKVAAKHAYSQPSKAEILKVLEEAGVSKAHVELAVRHGVNVVLSSYAMQSEKGIHIKIKAILAGRRDVISRTRIASRASMAPQARDMLRLIFMDMEEAGYDPTRKQVLSAEKPRPEKTGQKPEKPAERQYTYERSPNRGLMTAGWVVMGFGAAQLIVGGGLFGDADARIRSRDEGDFPDLGAGITALTGVCFMIAGGIGMAVGTGLTLGGYLQRKKVEVREHNKIVLSPILTSDTAGIGIHSRF